MMFRYFGLAHSGLQFYENIIRAADYLLIRGEVDHARIGVTGASGTPEDSEQAGENVRAARRAKRCRAKRVGETHAGPHRRVDVRRFNMLGAAAP